MPSNDRVNVAAITIDQGLCVLEFPNLCVLDWDYRSSRVSKSESSGSITIDKPADAYGILALSVMQRPQERWVTYQTYGGIRALLTSTPVAADSYEAGVIAERLKPDEIYMKFCRERSAWAARISPKPKRNRSEDTIDLVGMLGNGNHHPEMLRGARLHHLMLLENGMTTIPMPDLRAVSQISSNDPF